MHSVRCVLLLQMWHVLCACVSACLSAHVSVCLSVCLCISLLVITVNPAKADELIEVLFGLWTLLGPGNHLLGWDPDTLSGTSYFWGGGISWLVYVSTVTCFVSSGMFNHHSVDQSWPVIKHREPLVCSQYTQCYSLGGSSDADLCCQSCGCLFRVSTTPGNLLQLEIAPGNLLKFSWCSWIFL